MPVSSLAAPDTGRRTAAIQGLANLAAFIAVNPDLPLGGKYSSDPFTVYVYGGSGARNLAELTRIARILGESVVTSGNGTMHTVARDFGGGVEYRAQVITARGTEAAA